MNIITSVMAETISIRGIQETQTREAVGDLLNLIWQMNYNGLTPTRGCTLHIATVGISQEIIKALEYMIK